MLFFALTFMYPGVRSVTMPLSILSETDGRPPGDAGGFGDVYAT